MNDTNVIIVYFLKRIFRYFSLRASRARSFYVVRVVVVVVLVLVVVVLETLCKTYLVTRIKNL